MRSCTCPRDGSYYCAWCQSLALRAGVTLRTKTVSNASVVPQDPLSIPGATPDTSQDLLEDSEGFSRYRVKRSKTEVRYAALLDLWQHEGMIYRWWYEPQKGLYLAPKTSYTPDFLIQRKPDGTKLEFHEVKGAWIRPQDWVKAKQAAALYPCYIFVLAQYKGGVWHHKLIPSQ